MRSDDLAPFEDGADGRFPLQNEVSRPLHRDTSGSWRVHSDWKTDRLVSGRSDLND